MILPTRHIATEVSLVSIGARALAQLRSPRSINDLWLAMRDQAGVVTFDRFCLALTLLYTLGVVDLRGDMLHRIGS
jgi:hypothetical protein